MGFRDSETIIEPVDGGGAFDSNEGSITSTSESSANALAAANSAEAALASKIAAELAETNAETAETNAETAETNAETAETNASTSATNAATSETNAATSETNAAASASAAASSAADAQSSEDDAEVSETNAANSAAAALVSENNASSSESNAATSAVTAATQAGISTTKAGEASVSAAAALVSENNAGTSETNAADSETNAATSATDAAASETNAATSATNAATSETNAATSATNAADSETNAATSAANAAASETNAANSATASASSATASASSSTAASASETAAASSATSASGSASSALNFQTQAGIYSSNAASSASSALSSKNSASSFATNSANSATSASNSSSTATTKASEAATSATNASTSETNAATSATNAATSETNAATSETNASNSATSANNSATAAQTAQAATELVFDNFDDKFLGTKSSDPSVDNDGNALVEGAMYYNSSSNAIKFYNGSSWEAPSVAASNSATAAATSATNASNSAGAALTSASNAANSATSAATSETNAASSASAASTSETNAATSATNSANSATAAQTAETNAETAQAAAETAETNAETAQAAAETAETNAETSETNAAASASTASTQAGIATTKAGEASTSATNAATSATNAATSETNAATSETNAATSETNAATSATASEASKVASVNAQAASETAETNAETAQAAAETAQTAAETAETNAATSETNAASSASSASTDAGTATTKAGEAATSATNAAASASTATTKASEASTSASNAATSETNAATSATNAATSETNSSNSATASASSASAASTSETNAATSETNAGNSATASASSASAASTSETNAATSASGAATSATNASTSATAAQTAQTAAEAALDSFDDRYLGEKSSDPTVDNDGDALVTGALYFSTGGGSLRVYDGTQWNPTAATTESIQDVVGSLITGTTGVSATYNDSGNSLTIAGTAATTSAAGTMSAADKTKLDGVEASATADQTAAEIRTLVESATDSNVFTDADHTKLGGIEAGATGDQTNAEIRAAVEAATDSNVFTDADHTKLNGIEASATNTAAPAISTNGSTPSLAAGITAAEVRSLIGAGTSSSNNATHTGEVTGSSALTIADNVVDAGNLKVTGNGTTSQFLRSDGDGSFTWATPIDTNTTYSVGDGGLTQKNFTTTLKNKLDGISAGATVDQTKADIDALNIDADTLDGQHGSYYTGYTDTAISNLVDSSPATLDTLNELAAALGDDPNFATTVSNNIGTKANKTITVSAGNGLTGGGDLTTNRTLNVGAGSGITVTADTVAHSDTSTLSGTYGSTSNSTKIDNITVDEFGHITEITTGGTGSMSSWNVQANSGTQVAVTNGEEVNFIDGSATTVSVTNQTNPTVQVNHADTSSQASVNNSGTTVIQDVTLDTYGHVTGLASKAMTLADLGYTGATNANYITNNNQLTNGAGYTTNVGDITGVTAGSGITGGGTSGTVTINHADTSSQASVDNSNGTVIQDITLDTYGHITGITSYNLDGRYYTESQADSRFVNVTGDTMTGGLIPDTPGDYDQTAITSLTNAPINYPEVNVGSSDTYLPAFHMRAVHSGGYRTHMNVGLHKDNSGWGNNSTGFYVALGGSDNNPTEAYKLTYGGQLNHTSAGRFFADNYHPNADKWTTARTLTLSGDASGSVSWDGSADASLSVTVADDSHNHVISNVDGLQTALDGKQAAGNYFTDGDTVLNMANNDGFSYNDSTNVMYVKLDGTDYQLWHTGNDGSSSGLDADLLDGNHASAFATSAQGTLANNALPKSGGTLTGDIVSNVRNKGVFGTYDSTKTDHIWSMGTAYRNHASGTNFGNLYGLAYKHTNNTTGGTMASGHQMVWCQNGTPNSAMGTNIWTSGSVIVGGTVDGRDVAADGTKLDTIATNANNYSFPYTVSSSASNSTVVQRHSSGYIYANYFNTTPNDIATGSITKIVAESGNDGFMRHATAPAVRSFLNVADGANNYSLPATPSVTGLYVADYIYHTGDSSTYLQFPGTTGEMRFVSNGNQVQKWGRSGNTTYTQFGDSVDVRLGDGGDFEMKFNGTDTYFINRAHTGGDVIFMGEGSDGANETAIRIDFSSAASSVALHYDNSQKLITNSTGVAISGAISYTNATMNDYIYHNGDTDTYMGFHAVDQWSVVTGGTQRLKVTNDTMTVAATLSMNGHTLDMNNNDIYGVDQIFHEGDTNTYMQFHAEDQWRVVTGGAERLEVNNSQITSTEPIHAPSFHGSGSSLTGVVLNSGGTMTGPLVIDTDNNSGGGLRLLVNQTSPNQDFYFAEEIVTNLTGSTATTGDREQGGIYIDLNSTATGGDTSNEHRVYGAYIDTYSTGDADLVCGVYAPTYAAPSVGTTGQVMGGYFLASDYGGAGGVTWVRGIHAKAQADNSGSSPSIMEGGAFEVKVYSDADSVGQLYGVKSNIRFDSGGGTKQSTSNPSYVYYAKYDNLTGVSQGNNSYLYYGADYGVRSPNAYGVYIAGDLDNYFGGKVTADSFVGDGSALTNLPSGSTTFGAVGTYVFGRRVGSNVDQGQFVAGSTYAGSTLYPAGISGNAATSTLTWIVSASTLYGGDTSSAALSGTWRAMGTTHPTERENPVTLFVRIS